MIKLSRARVNESLYWPLWVSWSDKIRCKVLGNKNTPEFHVFHGCLIDINRQRKESSEKVWKRVEGPSSPSSRSDNECYHSPPRWGVRPWQAWLQVRLTFRRYLFILLVMERHTESTVSYLRTQHSDPDRFRTQTSRLTIQCINRPTIITPRENGIGPLITLCSPKTGQGDESRSLSRASISGRHQKEESTLLCDMPRDQRVKGDKVKLTPFLFPWTWANLGRTRVCMPPSPPPPSFASQTFRGTPPRLHPYHNNTLDTYFSMLWICDRREKRVASKRTDHNKIWTDEWGNEQLRLICLVTSTRPPK